MFDCATLDRLPADPLEASPGGAHVTESLSLLCRGITHTHRGRIAVVSSFGADSAVLLALVAEVDPRTPVIFVDTKQHFAETLAYRDTLARQLGLTDVRTVGPRDLELQNADPAAELWRYDPDACCNLRKVTPLDRALAPFQAWISGRKRHQTLTRTALPPPRRSSATRAHRLASINWSLPPYSISNGAPVVRLSRKRAMQGA